MRDKLTSDVMDAFRHFLLAQGLPAQYKALGELSEAVIRLRSQIYDDAQHDSGIFAAIKN